MSNCESHGLRGKAMSEDSQNEIKVIEVEIALDNDRNRCKKCGSKDLEVRNYNMMWHDGDLYCKMCDTFVRTYDAG